MQASAGGADARRQQILDRRLAVLLLERDAPSSARMFFADGRQGISNQSQVLRRQQSLSRQHVRVGDGGLNVVADQRSEEHTSELQSQSNLVCRLLLEK